MCSKQRVHPNYSTTIAARRQTLISDVSDNPSAFLLHYHHNSNRSQLLSSSIGSVQEQPLSSLNVQSDLLERRFIRNMSKLQSKIGRNKTQKISGSASAKQTEDITHHEYFLPRREKSAIQPRNEKQSRKVAQVKQRNTVKRQGAQMEESKVHDIEERKTTKEGQNEAQLSEEKGLLSLDVKKNLENGGHFRRVRIGQSGVNFEFDLDYCKCV